jgi:UDP-glucose 4-epimerase
VVPLFIEQINAGGPVTITTDKMTRFLLTLNQAVDTVFAAVRGALPGETYIPKVPAVRMKDLAKAMIGTRKIKIEVIGIRPGEKEHEILISEEERFRAVDRGNYYAIQPILPELRPVAVKTAALKGEYSSETELLDYKAVQALVKRERLLERGGEQAEGELLV